MTVLRYLILILALALPSSQPAQAGEREVLELFRSYMNAIIDLGIEGTLQPGQQHEHHRYGYPYLTMPNSTTYLQLNASKKIRVRTTRDGHHYVRLKDLPSNKYCYVIGGHIGWYDRNERDECYINLNRFTWVR